MTLAISAAAPANAIRLGGNHIKINRAKIGNLMNRVNATDHTVTTRAF